MKEIPVPASAEQQQRVAASCKRLCTFLSVLFYIFTAVAVLSLVGVIVTVIVFEFKNGMSGVLCYALTGGFAGGSALGGCLAFLFAHLLHSADDRRLDYLERCDSPYSFFVGEGTLATFTETELILHGEGENALSVHIPYGEARFFSVCSRRAPREKGEWCVVIELPARYLAKKNHPVPAEEKILVQADRKERLLQTLSLRNLTLLGEQKEASHKKKFTLKAKYLLPMSEKRRRALVLGGIGFVAAAAGIPLAIIWEPTVGSILAVIGIFVLGRATASFLRAKSVLQFYEEGLFWRDQNGMDRIFLKWEEIERIFRGKEGSLEVRCMYGSYHLPDIAGAFEYLKEIRPEKCADRP